MWKDNYGRTDCQEHSLYVGDRNGRAEQESGFIESDHGPLGQFILTGSSVPADMSNVVHSGTGRIGWLRMRPMSLWESQESTGEVSLGELFTSPNQVSGINRVDIEQLAFLVCRGGWPLAVDMDREVALDQAFDYIETVEKRDISKVDGVERDPVRVHRLLRSLARNQGSQASLGTIRADLEANESIPDISLIRLLLLQHWVSVLMIS